MTPSKELDFKSSWDNTDQAVGDANWSLMWGTCRLLLLQKLNTNYMLLYLLAVLHPGGHLGVFIFMVCWTISILYKVYMKLLCLLSIIIVSSAKYMDWWAVVKKTVNLQNIEVVLHPKIHKDVFVLMKHEQSTLKTSDHIGCLRGQLGQIQEIKKATHSLEQMCQTRSTTELEVNN